MNRAPHAKRANLPRSLPASASPASTPPAYAQRAHRRTNGQAYSGKACSGNVRSPPSAIRASGKPQDGLQAVSARGLAGGSDLGRSRPVCGPPTRIREGRGTKRARAYPERRGEGKDHHEHETRNRDSGPHRGWAIWFNAEDNAPACKTFDDITARCILAHPESPFVHGYVAGLRDGMFMQSNVKTVDGVTWAVFLVSGEKACLPMNLPVGFETLVSPVRDYLLAQPPNQETWPFVSLMPKALSQAYPCPSSLGQ